VPLDDELNIKTDPYLNQQLLGKSAKLTLFIDAAGIQSADHVVELGAGYRDGS
jgi:hypothetical protein